MANVQVASLGQLLSQRARELGDRPAVLYAGTALSYANLERRANRAAQALLSLGVGRGDRIVFLDKNGLEFFDLLFGAAKIGAVLAPLNYRLAPAEMAWIVNDTGAPLLVAHEEFAGHVEAMRPELSQVRTVVQIGGQAQSHLSYDAWIQGASEDQPAFDSGTDEAALQIYTSGTTGRPKGVMLSHANLLALLQALPIIFDLRPEATMLIAMPLYHIGGSGGALGTFFQGGTVVLQREAETGAILRAIGEQGVSNAFLVPAVIRMLLLDPASRTTDFSTLRTIAYGASPIPEDTLVRAIERFGCGFVQSYGLTETAGPMTALTAAEHSLEGEAKRRLRSCGRPVPGSSVRIVDAATGQDAATGAVGEVWIQSPQNMLGYWRNPQATAETLLPGNWLRSGDAGYLDEDGYLYLYDRVKDMIVSGGENVYPAEVESVLCAHPSVADAAVIGVPDDQWGEAVKGVVVAAPGATLDPAALIAFARERLAGFKTPKSIDIVESLPRNPSGKLVKRELREPYWRGQERNIH
jgi:long-chain acyl-CoA synthetase